MSCAKKGKTSLVCLVLHSFVLVFVFFQVGNNLYSFI